MLKSLSTRFRALPVQVKASFWFLFCSVLQKGISTITTPIFTRLLSTSEYGNYNVFISWLGIATIFVSMNLSAGVYMQGLVKFDREKAVFSSSLQALSLTLTLAWTVVYLLFHEFWNAVFSLTTVQMLAMLLMIWTSAAFSFWASEQRVKLSYVKLVAVTLLVSFAKPVVGIIFVLHAEDKVTARILGLALVELIGYSGLFLSQMRRGKKFFSARFWKYALLFNLPLIPHYLSQTVLSSADRIMIERMSGASEAGIYSLAYSISMIMTLFNSALGQTISPWLYQKIRDKKLDDMAPVAYTSLLLIAGVNILLILFAPEVVRIFAPPQYYAAIWVIPPVAMSVYFIYMYDLFAKFAFYYEKTGYIMLASVVGAALNVLLNWIFIAKYGYTAAGYTTLFCYIVYTVAHYILMLAVCRKYVGCAKVYDLRVLLGITGGFLLLGFIGLGLYRNLALRYGFILLLCAAAYVKRKAIMDAVKSLLSKRKAPADPGSSSET